MASTQQKAHQKQANKINIHGFTQANNFKSSKLKESWTESKGEREREHTSGQWQSVAVQSSQSRKLASSARVQAA
jgi:ribosomal protein L32E